MKYLKYVAFSLVIALLIGFFVYLFKISMDYEKECTYKQDYITGTVTDKSKHRRLSSAKPVIYRTVYKTNISLPDGTGINFSGATVYNACEIGDEIMINVTYKYHDEELIGTNYETVDSQQNQQ